MNPILQSVENSYLKQESIGSFSVGDTVDVHTSIREGNRERVQVFRGTVIRHDRGHGKINETFTVRRIVDGVGVERVFPVHSPKVLKAEVTRRGKVRRAKLYYLRDRIGKATKTKERVLTKHDREAAQQGG